MPWDCSPAPPPPTPRPSNRTALRSELAEIFRIEVLEVGLELFRIERRCAGPTARLARLDRGQREQALAREDGRLEAQRNRDGIGRSGIDLDHRVTAVDVQLGVVGV